MMTARASGAPRRKLSPLKDAAWPFGVVGFALGAATIGLVAKSSPAEADSGLEQLVRKFIAPISPPRTAGDMMPVEAPSPGGTVAPVVSAAPSASASAPMEPGAFGGVIAPVEIPSAAPTASAKCSPGDPLCAPVHGHKPKSK